MPSSSGVVMLNAVGILLLTIGVVEGDWVFTWPYGEDGSCRCEEKDFGLRTFLTEDKCLEAFSESVYEYCSWNGGPPLVEKQCDFAISTTSGFHNSYCVGKCSEVVSGLLTMDEYMKECNLEIVVDFDYAVATLPTGCYSNHIFGYSDYNPSSIQHPPLKFFDKVSTASRCQELCQDVDGCAAFVWRAVPDHDSTSSFQNDPLSCILYDENFMKHVTEDPIPSSFGTPTEYCDVPAVGECASISFPRPSWNILEDQTCLTCGCEPRCIYYSDSHITGPAFCHKRVDRTPQDMCHYIRPSWTTSTTPEPECPTETCVEPPSTTSTTEEGSNNTDEGTSVTDVALTTTTEPAISKGSTTTFPATEPEGQTSTIPDLTQMTAQSDTALTTTTAAETTTTFPIQPSATPAGTREESSETGTTVRLDTTQQPTTEETTTDVLLETTTTSAPSAGQSTTAPEAGASTTSMTVPATPASTSKTSPGGCVPDCPDCPCFKESECDDCYSISDCMDEEC